MKAKVKVVKPPTRSVLRMRLVDFLGCDIQHDGWPCGTCFFSLSDKLTNKDWQALLFFRGDNKREDLNNLPKDINKSLIKIYNLVKPNDENQ